MAEKNYQLSMANLLRKSDKNFPPRDSKIIFLEPGLLSNRTLNPKERSPLTYRGGSERRIVLNLVGGQHRIPVYTDTRVNHRLTGEAATPLV